MTVPFSEVPDKTAFVHLDRLWWKEGGYAHAYDIWPHPSGSGPRLVGGCGTAFVRADGTQADPLVLLVQEHPD